MMDKNTSLYSFSYGMNQYILLMEWKGSHIQKAVVGENYLTAVVHELCYGNDMQSEN